MIKSHEGLFELFDQIGICYTNHHHVPTFTVEESQKLKHHIPGAHTKNLFLYNRKEEYFLITMLHDRRLDIKSFEKQLGRGRLSFASPRRLMACLGVEPGSVTPFGVVNDTEHKVMVILDKDMMDYELLNYHPLQNDMTVSLGRDDFHKFYAYTQHDPQVLNLPKI